IRDRNVTGVQTCALPISRYKNNADGFAGLSGARALAMDSQGSHLYVAGANGNAVAVLARQGDSDSGDFGALTFQEMVQNGTDGRSEERRVGKGGRCRGRE